MRQRGTGHFSGGELQREKVTGYSSSTTSEKRAPSLEAKSGDTITSIMWKVGQPPAQEELANNKEANGRLPRDESVLVLACTVAKGYGCYFNPSLFFQLGRTLGRNLPPHDITSRQITQQLKKLVVKGYMIFEGTKLVRGRRIPLYYPTDLGFQRFDLWIKQMPSPKPTIGQSNTSQDHHSGPA